MESVLSLRNSMGNYEISGLLIIFFYFFYNSNQKNRPMAMEKNYNIMCKKIINKIKILKYSFLQIQVSLIYLSKILVIKN